MLKVENISVSYGPIQALHGVSLDVTEGEVVGLVGANGVGKSTILNAISGVLSPTSGNITFKGETILNTPANKIVEQGLIHVPEGRRVFPRMTVDENLRLGAFTRTDYDKVIEDLERVFELFPILRERHDQSAGTLSGGQQQMLAIGRGLMAKPRLLMLDEPSMGLAPIIQDQIFDIIRDINAAGQTVLLVEQNARMALELSDRAYVMEPGKFAFSGTGKDLLDDDRVRQIYLGEG